PQPAAPHSGPAAARVGYPGCRLADAGVVRSSGQTAPMARRARSPRAQQARPLARPGARPLAVELTGPSDEVKASGAEAQLALCAPDHLRRLEQPLKYGFADRSSARKGLEVAAGVAIADRLGSIRQTAGPPI